MNFWLFSYQNTKGVNDAGMDYLAVPTATPQEQVYSGYVFREAPSTSCVNIPGLILPPGSQMFSGPTPGPILTPGSFMNMTNKDE